MKIKSILTWKFPIPIFGKRLSVLQVWAMGVVLLDGVGRLVKTEAAGSISTAVSVCHPNAISVYSGEVYPITPVLDFCLPEEEIETDPKFKIIKNVQSLRDAKVILYPENHYDIDSYKLQKKAIDILSSGQPGRQHSVLAEGIPHGITFQCDHYIRCIYPPHDGLPAKGFHVLIEPGSKYERYSHRTQESMLCGDGYNTQTPRAVTFYAHRVHKKYHCAGWDDPNIDTPQVLKRANELSDKGEVLKELFIYLTKLGKFLQKASSQGGIFPKDTVISILDKIQFCLEIGIAQLPKHLEAEKIKNILQNRDSVISKPGGVKFLLDQMGLFSVQVKTALESFERHALKEIGIGKRNKFMISAIRELQEVKKIKGKIHVPQGRKHIFPAGSNQHQYNLLKIKPEDPQFELAQYLQTLPHAIIMTGL